MKQYEFGGRGPYPRLILLLKPALFCLALIFSAAPILSAQSLSVKEAVKLTLQNNPALLNLYGDYRLLLSQTRQNRGLYDWATSLGFNYSDADQARQVVFQPSNVKQTTYELNLDKSFQTGTDFGIASSVVKTEDNSTFNLINSRYESNVSLSISQSLLDGFLGMDRRATLRTDKMKLKALSLRLWRDMELLTAGVLRNYWALWRDIQLYEVAQEAEIEAKEFLDETIRLSKLGLREKDEILQAEASHLVRQEEKLTAHSQMKNAWLRLKSDLGLHKKTEWEEIPELDDPQWSEENREGELMKEAFQSRADFLSAELNLDANRKLRKSLKDRLWPKLTALGGYSLTGLDPDLDDSLDQVQDFKIKGWNLGVSLSHSFGQNFDRSEIDSVDSAKLKAQATYQDVTNAVEEGIQVTANNFDLNLRLLELSRKVEDKRKAIEKLFRKKFSQGRISIQDLLRAQEESRQSRYRRKVAESTMAITQMNKELAVGTFLEKLGYSDRNPMPTLESFSND